MKRGMLASAGFTLVEVMVALVVITVGLLGMAALQAAALGRTTNARVQSLAALEAQSLVAVMRANSAYWQTTPPAGTVTVAATSNGGSVSGGALGTQTGNCQTAQCTPVQMAAYDLKTWGAQLSQVLPGASAAINCDSAAPPVCTVALTWSQKTAAALNAGTANKAASTTQTLTLVE